MDNLIKRFDAVADADLMLCEQRGIAYQKDFSVRVKYDSSYFEKVKAYEGSDIARAVNRGRCKLMSRHLSTDAIPKVFDFGSGTGDFVRWANAAGFDTKGFDVLPQSVEALRKENLYAQDPFPFDAVTAWDVLEHLDNPGNHPFGSMRKGTLLFCSVPIFSDLQSIRASKHYRPGEHLYYWTEQGFCDWLALYGFRLLEKSEHENAAGRDSIGAFAFIRDLPDYHDHIAAYQKMHSSGFYGASSTELYLDTVAEIVRSLKPASILDYACGRSDLVSHFWLDGRRKIAKYDPAIAKYECLPPGEYDLVLCCDLLEHIPMLFVERVLHEIRARSKTVFFTISTKLARAKLPDGRNAHVTLLSASEWIRFLEDVFGKVKRMPSKWEHELVLVTGRLAN